MLAAARQRPTFTGGRPPIIIGAQELNFRVRHGNGWDLLAVVTGQHREPVVPSKLDSDIRREKVFG